MILMKNRGLLAIVLAFIVLASIYSVTTPIFEASDELWHYPMVKYMADHGLQLPAQDPANPAAWRQEGSQPPLYYMMAAIITGWIDTSDLDQVRRINPHADIGVIRPDGNANMIVHHTDAEAFPWRGTTLAVHLARFFSIALSVGTVFVTYFLAHDLFPENEVIALGSAALTAFIPMFLFISGSVNNDNLSNLLGNTLTLLVVRLLKAEKQPTYRDYVYLGLCTGAGLLAKLNLGFFIPVIALGLVIVSIRTRNWRPFIGGGLIAGGLTVVIAGWWYWHNWQVYGDPTGLNMFLQMVGRRAIPANLPQLWSERHSFTQAYWGFFGGVNIALPDVIYLGFNIIGGVGLISGVIYLAYTLIRQNWSLERWLPVAIALIWPVVTFLSYLRWTAETPASQGRLIFVALSSLSLWMVVGLVWWLPRQWQHVCAGAIIAALALVASVTPFFVIRPIYAKPSAESHVEQPQDQFAATSGGQIALIQASVDTPLAHPEDYILISSQWQIEQPLTTNWSLFAHLVTPDGVIIGQRDVYPGQGNLATSDLNAGYNWRNTIAVPIPNTAYAPMTLDVEIGWYDLTTGDRMKLSDGQELFKVGTVLLEQRIEPEELDVPNPIRVNFDNQIELVGYSLNDLSPSIGQTIELTLYWRGLKKLDTDYKVFANILDPKSLTKYAASDGMPVNWQAPTTTWEPGVIIKDTHSLTIDPSAPPGIYETEIGLYSQNADGKIARLRIITADGGMANDYMNMTRVRIMPTGTS